jgi:hypothetical protein
VTAEPLAAPATAAQPSFHDPGESSWLARPDVLYGTTQAAAANPGIAGRLDEHLRDEVLRLVSATGDDLAQAIRAAWPGVHWQSVRDRPVTDVAASVLAAVAAAATADPRLAAAATAARGRVATAPSATVAKALQLDAPVLDNPVLHGDVARGLAAEFARLSGLAEPTAQYVISHAEALLNSTDATLGALAAQGTLTSQELGRLTLVMALARLTDDNVPLIASIQASGVPSLLPLVAWTADGWRQLIGTQHIAVPPGDTPASYVQTIMFNLESAYPAYALAVRGGDADVATLLARNPALDLSRADLTGGAAARLDWAGVPAQARARVEQELLSYQRVIPLADSTQDRLALKRAGYDSALAIAGQSESGFIRTSGVDETRARLIYARAHSAAQSIATHHAGLHDLLKTGFSNLPAANLAPLADQLRQVEGMNELFGSQDFCDCDESHSVLSAAAYFVDLMHFVDTKVSAPAFAHAGHADHPLLLRRRRPDLWTLQLTPAATTALIPYLEIVNEVLEAYLGQAGHADIYRQLADPGLTVSFRVPVNLPAAELRLYLDHFGLTLADIYRALALPDGQVRRAELGLTPELVSVITTPDPAGTPARIGHPGGYGDLDVQEVLRATGLGRDQLDALLASRFHPDLGAVTVVSRGDPGELQNIPQVLANLTAARLDFLHRFTRLWRATSWQVADLDLILATARDARLIGDDLDDRVIEVTARLATLQGRLLLQPEELCTLIGDMPVSAAYPSPAPVAERRLYERVFDLPSLFPLTGSASAGYTFHHYAFNTADAADTSTDPSSALLSTALGVSEADLETLLTLLAPGLGFDAAGNCVLDRRRLSLLYRHARLASAIQLPVADFVRLLGLALSPAGSAIDTLDQVEQVTACAAWLLGSRLSAAELRFVVDGAEDGAVTFSTTAGSAALLVQQVRSAGTTDVRAALRARLTAMFNVTAARLASLLGWVAVDIDGPEIGTALAASLAPDGTPANPGDLTPLIALCRQIERVVLLFSRYKLDDNTLAFLTAHPAALEITSPRSLRLSDIKSLALFATLAGDASGARDAVQAALIVPPAAADKVADQRLAQLWNVDRVIVSSLRGTLPPAGSPLRQLRRLREAAVLCRTLGISAHSLSLLGKDGSYDECSRARDIVAGAVSAKYTDADKREQVLQPLRDRVSARKRDALCDFILASRADLGFGSAADLYDYFLLDPDMGDCFRTSRVVAAISSVQLYVQRCLQDLEQTRPGAPVPQVRVPLERKLAAEWEWRKNFRVWQANRKVFLYPENYLDPDLLDIKTPLFEDIENDLLQQKVTTESATEAYQRYLTQFADLAHLRIAGSYFDELTHTYYFFGRTNQDPPVYYWRTWDGTTWTPWQKIDLAIDATTVSGLIHLGRLHLFWVETKTKDKTSIANGSSSLEYYEVTISLQYSALLPSGKWLHPQRIESLRPPQSANGAWNNRLYPPTSPLAMITDLSALLSAGALLTADLTTLILDQMEDTKTYRRVYPSASADTVLLRYINGYLPAPTITDRELDLFHNKLRSGRGAVPGLPSAPAVLLYPSGKTARLGVATAAYPSEPEFDLALEQLPLTILQAKVPTAPHVFLTKPFLYHPAAADETHTDHVLNMVHNRYPESVLLFSGQQYLIQMAPSAAALPASHQPRVPHGQPSPAPSSSAARGHAAGAAAPAAGPQQSLSRKSAVHGTSRRAVYEPREDYRGHAHQATSIGRTVVTAPTTDTSRWRMVRLSTSTADHIGEVLMRDGLDQLFDLKTQRSREEPVGLEIINPAELRPPDDNPDHLDFTGAMGAYYRELYLHIPWLIANALRAAGKHEDALRWYRRIFDPTAEDGAPADRCWRYIEFRGLTLPKLRAILTDQAAIAANEADPFNPHAIARLRPTAYQRAAVMATIGTLLDMGDALFTQDTMESVTEAGMIYNLATELLGPRPSRLGTCHTLPDAELTYDRLAAAFTSGSDMLLTLENLAYVNHAGPGNEAPHDLPMVAGPAVAHYTAAAATRRLSDAMHASVGDGRTAVPARPTPALPVLLQGTMAFCIPPNDVLLGLYDQVADRLHKIRNCLNIRGVRRDLALFAPPVDVMALVRAHAAGLSLEEAMAALEEPVPPYRFAHLIDRATQAAQTVQSFGAALLSALEKKDAEELVLLRSLHERTVLQMTKKVKTDQLDEARHQLEALQSAEKNAENRCHYYDGLISDGRSMWETTEEASKVLSAFGRDFQTYFHLGAAIAHLLPDVGSPFAMKFGGTQLGEAQSAFAAFSGSLASTIEGVGEAAAIEGRYQRREQEWRQQLLVAQQEVKQATAQRVAAEVRADIAEQELDIHQTTTDQADELDQFYKDKFTSLGLYNHLATTLTRLHRQAYDTAAGLARMAQRAYAFERDDTTSFIAPDNWQADKNGLLAGEKLAMQLRQLEAAYLRANVRQLEITQSLSLALLDPGALLTLRETGACEFTLPEILFDIAYPGQYKRVIRSARISIPSVVGPYTAVSAKLTLKDSKVRGQPSTDPGALVTLPPPPAPSIATSTAINDAGVFELSFRDERYLPFEGAGAISSWRLELPRQLRMFDYNTIPDVIMHLSYTARDDGAFRDTVETAIVDSLTTYASTVGMHRLFSLRQEFPDAFYQFLQAAGAGQETRVTLGQQHFPYFLRTRTLSASGASIYVQPKTATPIDTTGLTVSLNGNQNGSWAPVGDTSVSTASIPVSGPVLTAWSLKVTAGHLDPDAVGDLLILVKYAVS